MPSSASAWWISRSGARRKLPQPERTSQRTFLTPVWFQRKVRNRRLGRERILDVKLRSSQVRRARVRMAALAVGVVFGTVFGLYLLWRSGDWLLTRLVYDNSAFVI